jgi:dTDP-D-glucose 4,6-dehydratase
MRGDGTAIRTFTHVNDLLAAIDLIIEKGKQGIIYDVTNEFEATSIEHLCKSLNIKYELGSEIHPIKENIGNSWRLRELGWNPSTKMLNGFVSTSKYNL